MGSSCYVANTERLCFVFLKMKIREEKKTALTWNLFLLSAVCTMPMFSLPWCDRMLITKFTKNQKKYSVYFYFEMIRRRHDTLKRIYRIFWGLFRIYILQYISVNKQAYSSGVFCHFLFLVFISEGKKTNFVYLCDRLCSLLIESGQRLTTYKV